MTTLNEYQRNELQTTTNELIISTDSHDRNLRSQVTEATNIEIVTTASTSITWLNAGFQFDTTTDYASNDKVTVVSALFGL